MKPIVLWTATLLLLTFACGSDNEQQAPQHVANVAFYHWKSTFDWDAYSQTVWKKTAAQTLYLRLFDVKWTPPNGATPVAIVRLDAAPLPYGQMRVVPVVFVTNETFKNTAPKAIPLLAQRVAQKISATMGRIPFDELQIDCDWSAGTRVAYFAFLKELHEQLPGVSLGATIRLHQVKYRDKAGIPPVQRGMLMPYNLDNPTVLNGRNSIYDATEAGLYLMGSAPYPLPLDVAVPLFSWGVHFRGAEFRGFLHGLTPDAAAELDFLVQQDALFYRVLQDTLFQNQYLRTGDRVKVEAVDWPNIETLVQQSLEVLPNDTFNLAFFHLDRQVSGAFSAADLRELGFSK